jgi:hypothetical protein
LQEPRLLRSGDIITLGNVRLEYSCVTQATPIPPSAGPAAAESPLSFPFSLKLPSKMKEE